LTQLADFAPDFGNQSLLQNLSAEDMRLTDIYVYRVSNGTLVVKQSGLKASQILEAKNSFYYRMLIPGPLGNRSFGLGRTFASRAAWQEALGLAPELVGREADALRPGEQLKLIALGQITQITDTHAFVGTS